MVKEKKAKEVIEETPIVEAPPAVATTQTVDQALLEWHDELMKMGFVELAGRLLQAVNLMKLPKAKAVVDALLKNNLTQKEIANILAVIFCAL